MEKLADKLTMPDGYVWQVYYFQIKRLDRNYSAGELSFLMGKNDNYVSQLESYKREYWISDIFRLSQIYNIPHLDMMPDQLPPYRSVKVQFKMYDDRSFRYYEVYNVINANDPELLYKLVDVHFFNPYKPERFNELKSNLELHINKLVNDGYFFECRETIDIYLQCQNALGHPFYPRFLQEIIKDLTDNSTPPLKKITKGSSFSIQGVK